MSNDDDKPSAPGGGTFDALLRDIARIEPREPPTIDRRADSVPGEQPERGTVLAGRYRLEHRVGEGGSGVVWAAEHVVTGKMVALKILKPSSDSPTWRERLVREARAACAVRHPNVVAVHDVIDASGGSPVLVMDLLEGETFRSRLVRERTLPITAALDVMLPVISAVGTAHASGVVHRDLKPENVFLMRDGGAAGVRVLDFGIAKVTSAQGAAPAESLTATGSVVGTIYYMAPEQVYGERDIDHRADVWALGVMLYECLSGRRPTEGENVGQVMKLITSGGIAPLRHVSPDVPADVADLVTRMLERDVTRRLQDLRTVRDVLSGYSHLAVATFAQPVSVRATGPAREALPDPQPQSATTETFEGVGLVSGEPPPSEIPRDVAQRSPRRRRPLPRVLMIVSILAVGAAGLGAFSMRARAPESAPPSPSLASEVETRATPDGPPPSASGAPLTEPKVAAVAPSASVANGIPLSLPTRSHVGALTSSPPHAKSAPDAGAGAAPSGTPQPRTTPQGIVETPPF